VADIELSVGATGAAQAAGDIDRVTASANRAGPALDRTAKSVDRTTSSYDAFSKKLSGEVLRNAVGTFALLGVNATSAADKVSQVAGAFAQLPGPIGGVAAAVTVAATAWSYFEKSAEAARQKTEAEVEGIRQALAKVGQAQAAVVNRAGGVAGLAPEARAFVTGGGDENARKALQNLMPGNAAGSLTGALELNKLPDAAARSGVLETLQGARDIGTEITPDTIAKAVAARLAEIDTGAGGRLAGRSAIMGDVQTVQRQALTEVDRVSEISGLTYEETQARLARSRTPYARAVAVNAAAVESVGVQSANQQAFDATTGAISSSAAQEALNQAARSTAGSFADLAKAVRDAQAALDAAAAANPAAAKAAGLTFPAPGSQQ
jgi:hypothetical protein